ncbi:hypothetical protein CRYUN_Cryun36dG0056700 [Craigia yunnanensis]
MESSAGNQDASILAYIQELMKIIQASQERMQMLKENNKQMMETISKFASSTINFLATMTMLIKDQPMILYLASIPH